jgi:hypothetical protein
MVGNGILNVSLHVYAMPYVSLNEHTLAIQTN